MDDESGESMEPMEEVLLVGIVPTVLQSRQNQTFGNV